MRPVLIAGKVVTLTRILSRKLEPVSIWIMEVDRAAHPVVDRPFDRHPALLEPALPRMEGVVVLDPHREMKVHAPLRLNSKVCSPPSTSKNAMKFASSALWLPMSKKMCI